MYVQNSGINSKNIHNVLFRRAREGVPVNVRAKWLNAFAELDGGSGIMCKAFPVGLNGFFPPAESGTYTPNRPHSVVIIGQMPLDHLSDEELSLRFRGSAADSSEGELCINELFRRNYAKVARWCLRFTSDRETAADLSQEIFAKAYQNLTSFQGQSKFSTGFSADRTQPIPVRLLSHCHSSR